MWARVAAIGMFAPTLFALVGATPNPELFFFGTVVAISALAFGAAQAQSLAITKRLICTVIFMLSIMWILDGISANLFDVQVVYPWWGIIEICLTLFVAISYLVRLGCTTETKCYVYRRIPVTMQDLVAMVLSGSTSCAAVEYDGKFYGFRKGTLQLLQNFNPGPYERRFGRESVGAVLASNVGQPWRPWFNCLIVLKRARKDVF